MVIFFIVILASSLQAFSPKVAFGELYIFVGWLIIYFLIISIVNTEKRFLIFMLAFLIYSFKMSQFSFRNWLSSGFSFIAIGSGGGPGWFHNSGEFGIQMVIFFSVAVCFFVSLKEYWPRWKQVVLFLFPLTALTGTVSSSSRGAVLGVASVCLFWLLKTKHKLKGIIILGIVASIVYSIIPEQQMARFQTMGEDETSTSRIDLMNNGLQLISRYPVLGVGYKNWIVAQKKVFGIDNSQVSHNIFIECASELGYLGLLVFLLMIIYTFVNNFKVRKIVKSSGRDNRFLYFMAHGLDGALVGYIVCGFFVTVLYYPYFWINLAMTTSLHETAKKWASDINEREEITAG